jgi:hypothetical protein
VRIPQKAGELLAIANIMPTAQSLQIFIGSELARVLKSLERFEKFRIV